MRDLLERYYSDWSEAAARLLDQGNERGEFDITDTGCTARSLVELLDGAFLVWTVLPGTVDLSERMRSALDLLARGLSTGTAAQ
nr:hypothetical protein [Streptomonospora litoralis]